MFNLKNNFLSAAALAVMGCGAASAATFDAIGDTASFGGTAAGSPYSLVTQIDFELTGIDSTTNAGFTTWTFGIDVFNETETSLSEARRLTIFGMNTSPNLVDNTSTIDQGWFTADDPTGINVPNSAAVPDHEICAKDGGGGNCSGGGNGGIDAGDSISFVFSLQTVTPSPDVELTIDSVFARYQSIDFTPEGESSATGSWAYLLDECIPGQFDCPRDTTPDPIPSACRSSSDADDRWCRRIHAQALAEIRLNA